jgi:hypothetical protein
MIKKFSLICLFLTVSLGFYNNGHSQLPSEYALIRVPVQENPEIWKMTKSEALQAFETQLFINPLSASQSYVMTPWYELWSGVAFELDHGWNRMIFSECLDAWISGYGALGSGTGQFRWPRKLDCEAVCNEDYWTAYYYIFVADASNDRIVKLRYDWRPEDQTIDSIGMFADSGLALPQGLDINNDGDFYPVTNDYLWVLNGNSQIKRFTFNGTLMKTYGSYGHGEGQFCRPTAIACGRNPFIPGAPFANNTHIYVADRGNNRLIWLIKWSVSEDIEWWKEIYLDQDIVDLEVDNFGQVWAVDRSNGQFIKYTYDLIPLCTFGSSGFDENQFWKPVSISNTGGYLGCGNMYVLESWTDSSGGQYFVMGTDILDFNVSSDDSHHVHLADFVLIDPAGTYFKIYNESGALIRTVKAGYVCFSGPTTEIWDGKDDDSVAVPSGNYKIQVSAASVYANVNEPGYPRADSITKEGWVCNVHPDDIIGDANGDGSVSVSDAVYLISYLFKGGPAPDPLWKGDVNGYCGVSTADIIYLNYYLFSGGPPPQLNFSCSPPWNCQL